MPAEIGTDIQKAAQILMDDELVAIPTETVYGLAANACSETAVQKIFSAKNRPFFDPLIVHVASIWAAQPYVKDFPAKARALFEAFSPGPLTILLPKSAKISDLVTAGSDKVALRIPAHPITQELLKKVPFPLAAPSANPFGYVSPTSAEHVMNGLGERIKYILDGGESKIGLESTIVGQESGKWVIYRLGTVTREQIEKVIHEPVMVKMNPVHIAAPGQLKSHYAPNKPLFQGDVEQLALEHPGKKLGIITLQKSYEKLLPSMSLVLSIKADLDEAATKLYSAMRLMDISPVDVILVEKFKEEGVGLALNDRVYKASVKR